jgi:hypothetical protein
MKTYHGDYSLLTAQLEDNAHRGEIIPRRWQQNTWAQEGHAQHEQNTLGIIGVISCKSFFSLKRPNAMLCTLRTGSDYALNNEVLFLIQKPKSRSDLHDYVRYT